MASSNGEKKEPQSFALIIEEADHGRINQILSKDFADILDTVTTKADLHETEWSGELELKIKVKAEPNGKVTLVTTRKVKVDEEPLPKARMYHDPDRRTLGNSPPGQIRIPGFNPNGTPVKPAKSASAPKSGDAAEE